MMVTLVALGFNVTLVDLAFIASIIALFTSLFTLAYVVWTND